MPLRMFNFLRETSKWRPAEAQFCVGDNKFESLKMTQSIVVQGNNLLTLKNFFNFVFKFLLFSVFFSVGQCGNQVSSSKLNFFCLLYLIIRIV